MFNSIMGIAASVVAFGSGFFGFTSQPFPHQPPPQIATSSSMLIASTTSDIPPPPPPPYGATGSSTPSDWHTASSTGMIMGRHYFADHYASSTGQGTTSTLMHHPFMGTTTPLMTQDHMMQGMHMASTSGDSMAMMPMDSTSTPQATPPKSIWMKIFNFF